MINGLEKYIATLHLLLAQDLEKRAKEFISAFIAQSYYALGKSYLELAQPILALQKAEELLNNSAFEKYADSALWLQYNIYKQTNKKAQMIACLEQIITFYRQQKTTAKQKNPNKSYLSALKKILVESTFIKGYNYSPYLNDFEKKSSHLAERLDLYYQLANSFYSNYQTNKSLFFLKNYLP